MALVLLDTIIGDGIDTHIALLIERETANTAHSPKCFGGETAVFDSLRHLVCTLAANKRGILCVNGLRQGGGSHCGHNKHLFEIHYCLLIYGRFYEMRRMDASIPARCQKDTLRPSLTTCGNHAYFLRDCCAFIIASCCFCRASRRAARPLGFLLGLFLLAR